MSSSVLEEYRDAIRTQDTHKRLKLAEDLTKILNDPSLDVVGSGADQLIDGLLSWINSSNFKISCQGLELVSLIATRMSSHFKPHISSAIPSVIDRLGDSKQVVRDQSIDTILKFMSPASNPQYVFDILVNHFNHKNWRVREVLMIVLTQAISAFGASCIQISKITPHLVKLISDPTGQVRDTAVDTMVEIYRHVGERFQSDLMKRNIPEAKLNNILSKFDETQKSGNMVSASQTDGAAIETPVEKKKLAKGVRRSTSFSAGDKKKNHISLEKGMGVSGAVDETDFMTAWEEVADPKVFSTRDVALELERINEILSDANKDWEKRVEALQQLRSFVKISSQLDDFTKLAKDLEIALRVSVKDLRSSVVKEACITISFMASKMENSFDYLAEAMVPSLISLIPNSVKIMATSGHAAMRLIIKHTATPRLIPIIVSNLLTSKSKEIRRRSAEYMGLLLEVWDTSVLKMHVALLEEAICKGVGDADSEARAAVRRAYWHFADHYKSRAESLMQKFDSSKQKLLQSDRNLLTTGVNQPTQESGRIKAKTVRSTSDSTSSKKKPTRNGFAVPAPVPPTMQRSASQLEYKRVTPHMTPRQKSCEDLKKRAVRPASVREGRTRHAQRSVTSQPTSRSGSPKRAVQMPTMNRERSEDYMKVYTLQKTRIPTPSKNSSRPASRSSSRQASRDPSPVRYQVSAQYEKGVTEDAVWNALQKRGKARRQRTASQTSMNGQGSDESDSSSLFSQEPGKKKNIVTRETFKGQKFIIHNMARKILYYLNTIPVPENIQSYLTSYQSPSLSFVKKNETPAPENNERGGRDTRGSKNEQQRISSTRQLLRHDPTNVIEVDTLKSKIPLRAPTPDLQRDHFLDLNNNTSFVEREQDEFSLQQNHRNAASKHRNLPTEFERTYFQSDHIHGTLSNSSTISPAPSSLNSTFDSSLENFLKLEKRIENMNTNSCPSLFRTSLSRTSSRQSSHSTSMIPVPIRSKSSERLRKLANYSRSPSASSEGRQENGCCITRSSPSSFHEEKITGKLQQTFTAIPQVHIRRSSTEIRHHGASCSDEFVIGSYIENKSYFQQTRDINRFSEQPVCARSQNLKSTPYTELQVSRVKRNCLENPTSQRLETPTSLNSIPQCIEVSSKSAQCMSCSWHESSLSSKHSKSQKHRSDNRSKSTPVPRSCSESPQRRFYSRSKSPSLIGKRRKEPDEATTCLFVNNNSNSDNNNSSSNKTSWSDHNKRNEYDNEHRCKTFMWCPSPWEQNRIGSPAVSRCKSSDHYPNQLVTATEEYFAKIKDDTRSSMLLTHRLSNERKLSLQSPCSSLSSFSDYVLLIPPVNITQHISEILSLLQQDASSSKRDGLISMQSFLHGLNSLSLQDTMHIKEIFNRYFAEPNSKIYSVFLDTLSEFIVQYKNDLQDWLFVLLTRLLSRISTDILPSAQTKISRVLDIVRDSYSYDHQFQIITKYIIDNTQTPSLKMKFHLLQYLTGLIGRMDASDFTNTAPIRLSVSRIVTWISEPKSPEVRSQAGEVVIGLFQLNTAEFTNLLASIPSSIQEGASRVIKTHMNQSSQAFQTPPRNTAYQSNSGLHTAPVSRREQVDKPLYRTASASKQRSNSRSDQYLADNSITQDPKSRDDSFGDHDSIGIHSRIPRKHLFQSSPKDTISTPIKNSTKTPASTPFSYATHMGSTDNSPMWLTSKDASYNPKQYEDSLTDSRFSQNASFASPMNRVADGAEQPEVVSSSVDLMNQISTVLSGPQSSGASEDKKNALLELLKMMRSGYEHNFGDKLQSLVPVLLDLLKHTEATIRCLAARALREVASTQPSVYRNDLKSFITPLLETESDTQSEVSKTAEECCTIVSQKLSADEILPVISPVAGDAPFPTNVSAIKMLNVVSDNCDSASMLKHLDTVVTNLLKAYDHEESSVRKAAVFCLVSVHNLAGADNVSSYFNSLAGSKVKLLNLYIRRSQSSNV